MVPRAEGCIPASANDQCRGFPYAVYDAVAIVANVSAERGDSIVVVGQDCFLETKLKEGRS